MAEGGALLRALGRVQRSMVRLGVEFTYRVVVGSNGAARVQLGYGSAPGQVGRGAVSCSPSRYTIGTVDSFLGEERRSSTGRFEWRINLDEVKFYLRGGEFSTTRDAWQVLCEDISDP